MATEVHRNVTSQISVLIPKKLSTLVFASKERKRLSNDVVLFRINVNGVSVKCEEKNNQQSETVYKYVNPGSFET